MLKNQMTTRWAGSVKRYHTWPTIRQQTIADHTWNMLRMHFEIFGELPEKVAVYIVYHDVGELKVGDPPYPIKRNNPVLKKEMDRVEAEALASFGVTLPDLTDYEKLRVKLCDALECREFAEEELALGNTTMTIVVDRIHRLTAELVPSLTVEDRIKWCQYLEKNNMLGG